MLDNITYMHYNRLLEENIKLKDENIELKTKLYDAAVKEQRLLKILNETDDYT